MRNYLKIILVLIVATTLSSCEPRERLYDNIVGYTWVGNLGFYDRYGDLESGVTLQRSGFGIDEQYYYPPLINPREPVYVLQIRWDLAGDNIVLDYGNDYPLLEIRGVYVIGSSLNGTLYVDGRYEGLVTLVRNR